MPSDNLACLLAENADLRAKIAELDACIDSLRHYIHTLNHDANVATLRALDAERMLAMHPETGEVR